MPNFDGGHYFLTALIPIEVAKLYPNGANVSSAVHMVRGVLSTWPPALQSPATEVIALNSPFSRNTRTHFARFVVIDDVVYNGRDTQDSLVTAIVRTNPVTPQKQDRLACPYLIFIADFDAESGAADQLASYLETLWGTMTDELRDLLQYCVGFASVNNAADFAAYIASCQIETTMPFNDYWVSPPPIPSLVPKLVGLVVVAVALVFILHKFSPLGWIVALLVAVAALVGCAYGLVMAHGQKPFLAAPNSDLPNVLKALYLQQKFVGFAVANQGAAPAALQAAFKEFLAEHRPTDLISPTQPTGIVRS